jgi:hypothetical protein
MEMSRKNRRTMMLIAFWVLGIATIAGLFYWAFARSKPDVG